MMIYYKLIDFQVSRCAHFIIAITERILYFLCDLRCPNHENKYHILMI